MKIGLCISGGFARGAAQAGFLKAFFEEVKREDIALISACSIGAINAISVANNSLDYLDFLWRTIDVFDFKNLKINLGNKVVDRLLEDISNPSRKIEIPIYVTGTCLNTLSTHYFYLNDKTPREDVIKALNITLTFPFVNGLFRREYHRFYLDGGSTDNIPVYPFYYYDLDMIIVLHCHPNYLPPRKMILGKTPIIDIDVTALCKNTISTYSFSNKNLNRLYELGYQYGLKFKQEVLVGLTKENAKTRFQKFLRENADLRKQNKINLGAAIFFNKLMNSRYLK